MARSFGAEALGADGFAVRGPVSAAPAVGCALVELGSNQLGWTSAPVALNSDLSLKANRSGDTFTGDVAINRLWTSNPIGATHAFTISRQVSGAAAFTDNTPLMKMEHIANVAYPYAGFVINHNTTVPGANPGGSYLSLGGPTNSFGLQFDYLANVGTPNYQGDVRYMLTGAQSKHIFQVNTGATPTEVGRFDANGLLAGAIRSGGVGIKLGGTADIEFAPTDVDGVTDALIIRNSANLLDVRANGGLRIRNLANNANAPLSCESITAPSLNLTGAAGTVLLSASGNSVFQVQVGLNTVAGLNSSGVWALASGGGINFSSTANYNGVADIRAVRNAAGQLDVRADSGLRVRNLANSADAALTAGAGTFGSTVEVLGTSQRLSVYNTFTNVSNYERFSIAGTAGIGWTVGIEQAGTGSTNRSITINAGSAGLYLSQNGSQQLRIVGGVLQSAVSGGYEIDCGVNAPIYHFRDAVNSGMHLGSTTSGSRSVVMHTDGAAALTLGGSGTGRQATFAGGLTIGSVGSPVNSVFNGSIDGAIGLLVRPNATTSTGLTVRGLTGQTANIFEVQTSAVNPLFTVSQGATLTQGVQDARWTIPSAGLRNSEVGNGAGVWQTGYREAYNVSGVRAGFFGVTPVAQQSIAAAATDPATTQTLANSLRTAMLNLGLGV
jgi:hypothetical protein